MDVVSLTWLIPVIPVLAFIAITAAGRKAPGQGAYVGIGALGASFLLALGVFFGKNAQVTHSWLTFGQGTGITAGYLVDPLTKMMLIVVSFVSLMVVTYSIGYMHGDPRYPRYFSFICLFSGAMLGLVIASNILMMYVCWELVGLTSYLLIGFWFEKPSAMRAAKKAFMVTRVGDVGMYLGMIMLYHYTGSFDFQAIFNPDHGVPALLKTGVISSGTLSLMGILIFMGAVGKSAQFPLHVWLPDAMEGPTPVSALIHAATMVAAGVYLVARFFPVLSLSPTTMLVIALIGTITALMAATTAVVMTDIKKVLAYSTISQLGYMMFGLGVGGYVAGSFHLMTHAFFKALLFLGSGSVIHGLAGEQDMRQMGGLRKKMPITFATFLIGTLALAGFPGFAGFFSKDEILLSAFRSQLMWNGVRVGPYIFAAGVLGAFLTAFYMSRLCFLTFWGEPRNKELYEHAHESPKVMTVPLMLLSVLAIFAGYIQTPWTGWFHHFITGSTGLLPMEAEASSGLVMLCGFAAVALGILGGATVYYWKTVSSASLIRVAPWYYNVLTHKYYWDEIMYGITCTPMFFLSKYFFKFDKYIVDGLVNAVGWLTLLISRIGQWFDHWVVDGIVNLIGITTRGAGRALRVVQSGRVQNYILAAVIGLIAIFYIFANY